MNAYQLYLEFRTPEEIAADEKSEDELFKSVSQSFRSSVSIFRYRIYNERLYDFISDIPYGFRVLEWTDNVALSIKSTYQKFRYGVSDRECWDLSNTLSKFIIPRLKHFKKVNIHSIPGDLYKEVNFRKINEQGDKKFVEQWHAILDEMIFGFEYNLDSDKFCPFPDELLDNKNLTQERKTELMHAYINKRDALNERSQKGIDLFAKYFKGLWD